MTRIKAGNRHGTRIIRQTRTVGSGAGHCGAGHDTGHLLPVACIVACRQPGVRLLLWRQLLVDQVEANALGGADGPRDEVDEQADDDERSHEDKPLPGRGDA